MREQRGFTLIELITVMIIAGIIALYAAPRLTSKIFNVRAAAGELAEAIKYAQEMSMVHSGDTHYRIELQANSYRLTQGGTDIPDPLTQTTPFSGSWSDISLNQIGTITFDSRGRPTCSGGLAACSTPADTDLNIVLSAGSDSVTVTLARLTGYAYVQ